MFMGCVSFVCFLAYAFVAVGSELLHKQCLKWRANISGGSAFEAKTQASVTHAYSFTSPQ